MMKNDGQDVLNCGCGEEEEGKQEVHLGPFISTKQTHSFQMTSIANPFEQRATKKCLLHAQIAIVNPAWAIVM